MTPIPELPYPRNCPDILSHCVAPGSSCLINGTRLMSTPSAFSAGFNGPLKRAGRREIRRIKPTTQQLESCAGIQRRSGTGGVAAERKQAAGRKLTGRPPPIAHAPYFPSAHTLTPRSLLGPPPPLASLAAGLHQGSPVDSPLGLLRVSGASPQARPLRPAACAAPPPSAPAAPLPCRPPVSLGTERCGRSATVHWRRLGR